MSYRAIYTYAWDLAETGVAEAADEFRHLGLDTVTMAATYHAGKFLRPHGKAGKVYFPEDGTAYFRTDAARYGAIKPVANSLLATRDVLRELVETSGMAVNAWLVLLHNTRLGMAHPDAVVRNAFGDPYYYNLCPSAPDARAYAVGLARDVTESYAVAGISLEAPGFAPYAHGFHHEFALMRTNPWLENQLGLCFCDHCVAAAEARGIDARRLKAQVASDIHAFLDSDVDFPPDMAEAFWRADIAADGDLRRYLDFRNDVVTSLVTEIRAAARRCERCGDPFGGTAHRRRLVRGHRPRGPGRCRRHRRGLLLRAQRRTRPRRPLRHPPAPARYRQPPRHPAAVLSGPRDRGRIPRRRCGPARRRRRPARIL